MANTTDKVSLSESPIYVDDSEDEVFFAPFSEKQLEVARRYAKRRTEVYCRGFPLNRPSLIKFRVANNSTEETFNLHISSASTECVTQPSLNKSNVTYGIEDSKQSESEELENDSLLNESSVENISDSLEVHARESSECIRDSAKQFQQNYEDVENVPETSFEQDSATRSSSFYRNSASSSAVLEMAFEQNATHCELDSCSSHSLTSINCFYSEEQNLDGTIPSKDIITLVPQHNLPSQEHFIELAGLQHATDDHLLSEIQKPTSSSVSLLERKPTCGANIDENCVGTNDTSTDIKEQGCQTSFAFNLPTDSNDTSTEKVSGFAGSSAASGSNPGQSHVIASTAVSSVEKKRTAIPVFKLPARIPKSHASPLTKPLRVPLQCSQEEAAGKFGKTPRRFPQQKASIQSACSIKQRFRHITSPVSQYIHDAPPPPLIANSQPLSRQVKCSAHIATPRSATKIPQMMIRSKSKPSSGNKQVLIVNSKTSKEEAMHPKARSHLQFNMASGKGKENCEDSIVGKLGLTSEELNKIENKELKNEVMAFIKHKKALIEYSSRQQMENEVVVSHGQTSLPCCTYKGPPSLVLMKKEQELAKKLNTFKNKQITTSNPFHPVILKHIGQRKKLHLGSHMKSDVEKLSSPGQPTRIPSCIPQNSLVDNSCWVDGDLTIEASVVEAVNTIYAP